MSTRQINFATKGMHSARSAGQVESALEQLDGVVAVHVNLASERASVVYDPTMIQTATLISAVRETGFDTPLERVSVDVVDLIYASSAGAVERVLRGVEGVAGASVDLRARRVVVAALPERASRDYFEAVLARLGFHQGSLAGPNSTNGFVVRALLLLAAAILSALAVVKPFGIFNPDIDLVSPFWLITLAALGLFGAGYPFHRRALTAFAYGEYDWGVLMSFVTVAAVLGGLVLTLI